MNAPRGLDLDAAAESIADWGFLADPGTTSRLGPGYLITAIRRQPTFHHFDPESVRFWVTEHDRGVRMTLDRTSPVPWEHSLAWGAIRVSDRLGVSNDYLSFGGVVAADRIEDTTIVIFLSPAPLLRRGGHSQGWDPGADSAGAFFARLRAAVGASRDLERIVARADPVARYAAFIVDAGRRRDVLRSAQGSAPFVQNETARLRRNAPTLWAEGEFLARAVADANRVPFGQAAS